MELSLPLWRNAFGREVRANQEALEAQARATQHSERFGGKVTLVEAEAAYWRLSMAREMLQLQKESYARGAKLREWSLKRSTLQLADRFDLLQAESGLRIRSLDKQTALEEVQNAERQFNSLRGVSREEVVEELEPFGINTRLEIDISSTRDDVLAAEEALKASEAMAKVGQEKNRASLELYGQLSKNAAQVEQGEATSKSLSENHMATVVGVRWGRTSLQERSAASNLRRFTEPWESIKVLRIWNRPASISLAMMFLFEFLIWDKW